MASIKIDLNKMITNGSEAIFIAPCDCSQITGLIVSHLNDAGAKISTEFKFKDAHGHDLADVNNLFTKDAYVKIILNVDSQLAYIQNADTNMYLEGRLEGIATVVGNKLDDSKDGGMVIVPLGRSEQNTIPGNQLFDKSKVRDATETNTGFSFNGVSDNTPFVIAYKFSEIAPNLKAGDIVTHYGTTVNASIGDGNTFFYLSGSKTNWYSGTFITITDEILNGAVYVYGKSGLLCEYNNVIITKTKNAQYEPYIGGVPSPNPEYPQPIVSMGQKLMGNQLFSGVLEQGTYTSILQKTDNYNRVRSADSVPVTSGETYTISSNVAKQIALYQVKADGTPTEAAPWVDLPLTFTVENNINLITFAIKINDATEITPVGTNVMLNKGTKALPYEPYIGGKPTVVDIDIQYKIRNKNIVKSTILNAVTDPYIAVLFVEADFKPDTEYTISFTAGSGNYIYPNENLFTGGKAFNTVNGRNTITVRTNGTIDRANGAQYNSVYSGWVIFKNGNTQSSANTFKDVQIEEGNIATSYKPYQEQNLTLNKVLRALPVTDPSLATYTDKDGQMWRADYGDIERKVWIQRITEFKVTKAVGFDSSGKLFTCNTINSLYNNLKDKGIILCDKYINRSLTSARNNDYAIVHYGRTIYIANKDWNFDLETANAELSANPITVYGALATPIETPMTDEEVIALRSLSAYNGVTYITNDSDVQTVVKATYGNTESGALALKHENRDLIGIDTKPVKSAKLGEKKTYKGGLKINKLIGKSVQKITGTGKNLLQNTAKSKTENGITFTVNDDGTVIVNGTATDTVALSIDSLLLPLGDFILSGCPKGGSWNTYSLQYNYGSQDVGDTLNITISDSDTKKNVRILIYAGVTVSNAVFKPMLREADITDGTYEPYTNGPTPNPEFQEPIVSVGQKLLEGNQLFDKSKLINVTITDTGFSFTNKGENGAGIQIGTFKDLVPSLKVGDVITFYCTVINSSSSASGFLYIGATKRNWYGGTFITITEEDLNAIVYAYGNSNLLCEYNNVIFTKVENAPYEPYCGGVKSSHDVGIEYKTRGKNMINQLCVPANETDRHFLKAGVYTVSRDASEKGNNWYFGAFDANNSILTTSALVLPNYLLSSNNKWYYGDSSTTSVTFELLEDCYVGIFSLNGSGATYLMLNEGTEALPYEPHTESKANLDRVLRAIPVTDASLANYTDENGQMYVADYIDMERKVLVQRVQQVVLNGSETWIKSNTDANNYLYYMPMGNNPAIADSSHGLCNRLPDVNVTTNSTNGKDRVGYTLSPTYQVIYINVGYYLTDNTVEAMKGYLAEHQVVIQYIRKIPVEIPLTVDEITALHGLKTYDGVTYFSTTNDPDAHIDFEYGMSDVVALGLENSNLHIINEALATRCSKKYVKLWTNSDPSAEISKATTLFEMSPEEVDRYEYFIILYSGDTATANPTKQCVMSKPLGSGLGNNARLEGILKVGDTYHYHERVMAYTYSNNAFMVNVCTYITAENKAQYGHDKLIPHAIYGVY